MDERKMIYLDEAIDAVSRGCQEFRGIFAECEKNLNKLPSAQGYADTAYIEKMSELIFDSAFEMGKAYAQQWIPVSEKPKEEGEYLTTIVSKDDQGKETDRLMVSVLFKNGRWKLKGSEVIAWMPIEPWEGENDG